VLLLNTGSANGNRLCTSIFTKFGTNEHESSTIVTFNIMKDCRAIKLSVLKFSNSRPDNQTTLYTDFVNKDSSLPYLNFSRYYQVVLLEGIPEGIFEGKPGINLMGDKNFSLYF
jgi:hypothetical protein